MDINKKTELEEIGYRIGACCALCVHAVFPGPASPWGACEKHEYKHRKHTGEPRKLSICRFGHCREGFAPVAGVAARLAGFHNLVDFNEH